MNLPDSIETNISICHTPRLLGSQFYLGMVVGVGIGMLLMSFIAVMIMGKGGM